MAFASSQRHLTNGLPSHSFGNQEKHHRHSAPWTKPVSLAIPGVHTRRLRILVPNTGKLSHLGAGRLGRRRGPLLMCFIALSIFGVYFIVSRRYEGREWMEQWPSQSGDPSTLVFQRQDLQRIWKWEIASGHYPSRASSECFSIFVDSYIHGVQYRSTLGSKSCLTIQPSPLNFASFHRHATGHQRRPWPRTPTSTRWVPGPSECTWIFKANRRTLLTPRDQYLAVSPTWM